MPKRKQRFERGRGKSRRFWEIEIAGSCHTVRYGRVGMQGQTRTKAFSTASDARNSRDRLITAKTRSGYKLMEHTGPAISPSRLVSSDRGALREIEPRPLLKKVINRVLQLGGSLQLSRAASLESTLSAIAFPAGLYSKDWDGGGVRAFLKDHNDLAATGLKQLVDCAEAEFLSLESQYGVAAQWQLFRFCPFSKEGTDENWGCDFEVDQYVDLTEIREYAGDGPLEFLQLVYDSAGYPDQYFVCLQDPQPQNPTVFGTDHEMFFQEFYGFEPLSEFLDQFMTPRQFRRALKENIEHYAKRVA